MDERRRAPRYLLWFPMRVVREGSEEHARQAVSRNISTTGVLMCTATQLEVGSEVELTFKLMLDETKEHSAKGTIVRFGPNEDDPNGLWPYKVAVDFSPCAEDLEPLIDEAAEAFGADPEE